jgi:hypothetical protein
MRSPYDFSRPLRGFRGRCDQATGVLPNFHNMEPYVFTIPEGMFDPNVAERTALVTNSESPIMPVKAMLMRDARLRFGSLRQKCSRGRSGWTADTPILPRSMGRPYRNSGVRDCETEV